MHQGIGQNAASHVRQKDFLSQTIAVVNLVVPTENDYAM